MPWPPVVLVVVLVLVLVLVPVLAGGVPVLVVLVVLVVLIVLIVLAVFGACARARVIGAPAAAPPRPPAHRVPAA
ncbi:hypothetical protein ACFQZU_13735, partial [Streptomonospora algeriensis]